jgi:cadmium resistance protein CadD (predicted permease)
VIVRAVGLFALTNIDDLVLLTLYFGRYGDGGDGRDGWLRIIAGQYIGFAMILIVWRRQRESGAGTGTAPTSASPVSRASVTFANGADNVAVYVPVFATADTRRALLTYIVVFLAMVAIWWAAGRFLATRPPVARALARRGHIALPAALTAIGAAVLPDGTARAFESAGVDPGLRNGRSRAGRRGPRQRGRAVQTRRAGPHLVDVERRQRTGRHTNGIEGGLQRP